MQGCELGCLDAGRIVVLCSEVIIHPEAAPSRDVDQDVVACAVMCRCRYRRRLHMTIFFRHLRNMERWLVQGSASRC